MNRESVVALARLVAEVAGTPEPLIVGSQALYASLKDVPDEAPVSACPHPRRLGEPEQSRPTGRC